MASILATSLIAANCTEHTSAAPATAEQTIDAIIDSIVEHEGLQRGVPGMAVVVVADGHIVTQRAYGRADMSTGRAVTTATPFNIASVTKPFTASLVMQLIAEGTLRLDDPVRTHLEWLPECYRHITIRQLLTHTSGITRDLRTSNADDPDARTYRARLDSASSSAAPGERFEYSNTGYTVLGWLVETIERRPLEDVMRQRIFERLGMRHARYRAPLSDDPLRARPHAVVDGSARPIEYITGGFGSGGMSMAAADAAAFAIALQQQRFFLSSFADSAWSTGALGSGEDISLRMFGEPASYGFGWFLTRYAGRAMMTHGGGIEGYSANLYHFPAELLTIIVLANVKGRDDGTAPVDPITRKIADACLARNNCRLDPDAAELRKEIAAANRTFSDAYVAADTAAIRVMYATEAIALPPNARAMVGARAISRLFQAPRNNRRLDHALYTEMLIRHGPTVIEFGTWFDRWRNALTSSEGESTGRYTLTWVRQDGGLRIALDTWVPAQFGD